MKLCEGLPRCIHGTEQGKGSNHDDYVYGNHAFNVASKVSNVTNFTDVLFWFKMIDWIKDKRGIELVYVQPPRSSEG